MNYLYISRALSPYCNLITFLLILVDFQHIMNVNFFVIQNLDINIVNVFLLAFFGIFSHKSDNLACKVAVIYSTPSRSTLYHLLSTPYIRQKF